MDLLDTCNRVRPNATKLLDKRFAITEFKHDLDQESLVAWLYYHLARATVGVVLNVEFIRNASTEAIENYITTAIQNANEELRVFVDRKQPDTRQQAEHGT